MEGDAGTSRLTPPQDDSGAATEAADTPDPTGATAPAENTLDPSDPSHPTAEGAPARRAEHFGRGWFAAVCAVLVLVTAGVLTTGVLALRADHRDAAVARDDAAALARAKDCVQATQAPNTSAVTASQSRIIECSTGQFAVQANLYAGIIAEAYQAGGVQVSLTDMKAAVERHNPDDSVDVLVALRVKVSNLQAADQETGYRLRVQMAKVDDVYRVAKLDQVAGS